MKHRKFRTIAATAALIAAIPASALAVYAEETSSDEPVLTEKAEDTEKEHTFRKKKDEKPERKQEGSENSGISGLPPALNGENGELPGLPEKKSDEEAMADGNEKPELPADIKGLGNRPPLHFSGRTGMIRPE